MPGDYARARCVGDGRVGGRRADPKVRAREATNAHAPTRPRSLPRRCPLCRLRGRRRAAEPDSVRERSPCGAASRARRASAFGGLRGDQRPGGALPASPGDLLTEPFGDRRFGFVLASSHNGRFVVLRRFEGAEPPDFGHHGEASQSAEQTLFDRVSGDEHAIGDLIDVDEARRFFLLVSRGVPVVADADTGAFLALDGAEGGDDGNACLPPRQAAFSEHGHRVGWVTAKGLAVRELAGTSAAKPWLVPADGRLWRGFPDEGGHGAVLLEVPAGSTDWPRQNTSCACRWCGRFAMSYGFYGWSGPAFAVTHVAEDGARTPGEPPEGGGNWHALTDTGCELVAAVPDERLERGPWRWRCGR